MTLMQMKYFQSICRCGGFIKAAEALAVSQPAVSIAVRELEQELGIKLLIRDGKSIQLTEAGEHFLQHCDSLLSHADSMLQSMQDLAQQQKRIRQGMTPSLAMMIMPQLFRDYGEQHPDIMLEAVEAPRHTLITMLEHRQLDVMLSNLVPQMQKMYLNTELPCQEYCFCVSKNHPLADRATITVPQIGQTPLACFGWEYEQAQFIRDIFQPYGIEPTLRYQTSQLSTLKEMIVHNHFGGFLYRSLAPKWPELHFITLDPVLEVQPHFFWSKDSYLQKEIHDLIACTRNIVR